MRGAPEKSPYVTLEEGPYNEEAKPSTPSLRDVVGADAVPPPLTRRDTRGLDEEQEERFKNLPDREHGASDFAQDAHKAGLTVIRSLGEGANGTVYEVERQSDGKRFALKWLNSTRPGWIPRRLREVRGHSLVVHENVLRLEAYGSLGAWEYILVELCDCSLYQWLVERNAFLSLDDIVMLALGLFQGLAAIHASHVLHKDLTPQNVLLVSVVTDGRRVLRPKISDFGIAEVATSPLHGANVKANYLLAPELWEDAHAPFTTKQDVWSLGAVLLSVAKRDAHSWRGRSKKLWVAPRDDVAQRYGPQLASVIGWILDTTPNNRPSAAQVCERLRTDFPGIVTREPALEPYKPTVTPTEAVVQAAVKFCNLRRLAKNFDVARAFLTFVEPHMAREEARVLPKSLKFSYHFQRALLQLVDVQDTALRQHRTAFEETVRDCERIMREAAEYADRDAQMQLANLRALLQLERATFCKNDHRTEECVALATEAAREIRASLAAAKDAGGHVRAFQNGKNLAELLLLLAEVDFESGGGPTPNTEHAADALDVLRDANASLDRSVQADSTMSGERAANLWRDRRILLLLQCKALFFMHRLDECADSCQAMMNDDDSADWMQRCRLLQVFANCSLHQKMQRRFEQQCGQILQLLEEQFDQQGRLLKQYARTTVLRHLMCLATWDVPNLQPRIGKLMDEVCPTETK